MGCLLRNSQKGGWQEAFAKDSDLVQQARETYFRMNWPEFDHKSLHALAGLFWEMIASIGLLDSQDL